MDAKRTLRETVQEQIAQAHAKGRRCYKTHRRITQDQEAAYRLCHHDFAGLPQKDAAEVMGVSPQRVGRLLAHVKQIAPQLFPILIPRIAKMYELFADGYTCREIAENLGVTPRTVQSAIRELTQRGDLYFKRNSKRRLSFEDWMSDTVKIKF